MKKLNNWVNKNKSFVVCIFSFSQWFLLSILFVVQNLIEIEQFWLDTSFVLVVIGCLVIIITLFLYIFFIIKKKRIEKIIDSIFLFGFYIYFLGLIHFLYVGFFGLKFPLLFFVVPSFMFAIIIVEKIYHKKSMENRNE